MICKKQKLIGAFVVTFAVIGIGHCSILRAQQQKKRFTAKDETELWSFIPGFDGSNVHFSPDKYYFVVFCQRGRLDLNRSEDALRFYRADDVLAFLKHPGEAQPPKAAWVMSVSTAKEGPNIESWSYRWLPDSTGVAFLQRTSDGTQRLALADLRRKELVPLTPTTEDVQRFSVRDRNHYAYTAASSPAERGSIEKEAHSPAVVATGRGLAQLLMPQDPFRQGSFFGQNTPALGGNRWKTL